MKRETIITISGADGDEGVLVKVDFNPKLQAGEEPPDSGWANATKAMLNAIGCINGERKTMEVAGQESK